MFKQELKDAQDFCDRTLKKSRDLSKLAKVAMEFIISKEYYIEFIKFRAEQEKDKKSKKSS